MKEKPTMEKIAKKLNISINAVSLALNNKQGIGEEMRKKIFKVADDLGYFNNKSKYLIHYSNNNLCLLLQHKDFNDFLFYSNIIYGIEEETKKNHYDLIFVFVDYDNFTIPNCIENRKVSGILLLGKIPKIHLKQIVTYNIPILLIDTSDLEFDLDSITTNNKSGTYKACKYLFSKNIFDIGFFGDISYSYSIKERFSGVEQALLEYFNMDYQNTISHLLNCSILQNLEKDIIDKDTNAVANKLKEIHHIPKAFVCSNDNAAIQLINALDFLGYRVPEDISVIGFDNIELSAIINPKLTTLNVDKKVMGNKAVKKLLSRMANKNQPSEQIMMNVELIERNSVKE